MTQAVNDGESRSKGKEGKGGKKGSHVVFKKTERKWKVEEKEMDKLVGRYEEIDTNQIQTFAELPLSTATQKGLKDAGFTQPTGEKSRA